MTPGLQDSERAIGASGNLEPGRHGGVIHGRKLLNFKNLTVVSAGLSGPAGGSVRARGAVLVGEFVAPGWLEFRFAKWLFAIGA